MLFAATFFMNETETIGRIMTAGTQNLTGNIIATIFLVLVFLVVIAMMFGIPLEFLAVIILPFCLALAAFKSEFVVAVALIALYVVSIFAKNWLFK